MSDGTVLEYVVTEVRPNVPCPDPNATTNNPPNPPLALQIHDDCEEGRFWTIPTEYERLTLQTSQGYNRNWGELVVVAEPIGRERSRWTARLSGPGTSRLNEPRRHEGDDRHAQRDREDEPEHVGGLPL